MLLESLGVSGLSHTLIQVTQLWPIGPRLVSLLPRLQGSPLVSHSHLQALSAASAILRMALLFLSPSMPKYLRALAKEWAAEPLQPASTGTHLTLHPARCLGAG